MDTANYIPAKPFLKWAGGKTQLLVEIEKNLPQDLSINTYTYIEPFVGSGAVMFWILNKYPNINNVIINDINTDLINCYRTIKSNVNDLISILEKWEKEYHGLTNDLNVRKKYYYNKRQLFNKRTSDIINQSALFIFLNRTCFNGLYRVNRKNEFNVPIGSYTKPQICNSENLKSVSVLLGRVIILNEDYVKTITYTSENTLFYFDPPYKPLSKTANFNSYAKDEFDDKEQIRLKKFCDKLEKENHQWILSNSDVKAEDETNNFFDDLYSEFNISRVNTRRSINADPSKRGKLTELLIKN